jgi:hypothetical protein
MCASLLWLSFSAWLPHRIQLIGEFVCQLVGLDVPANMLAADLLAIDFRFAHFVSDFIITSVAVGVFAAEVCAVHFLPAPLIPANPTSEIGALLKTQPICSPARASLSVCWLRIWWPIVY